jgi:hypothetical protein
MLSIHFNLISVNCTVIVNDLTALNGILVNSIKPN